MVFAPAINLKWVTLLLSALFFYDVFMVYISSFITKGCSIMVDVATGGTCSKASNSTAYGLPDKTREDLPVLFRVPRLDPSYVCYDLEIEYLPSNMLGLTDIIIPVLLYLGFLVGFGYAFDLGWNVPYSLYFVVAVIGYFVGLITTFIVLILSGPQPALVFLVPFTLIPVHLLAVARKQWKLMWKGVYPLPDSETLQKLAAKKTENEKSDSFYILF